MQARGPHPRFCLPSAALEAASTGRALRGRRAVYFREHHAYVRTPVYDRYALGAGASCTGPAIVEERESTLVVPPGWTVTADAHNNLIAEPDAAP